MALGDEAGIVGRNAFVHAGFSDPALALHWDEIAGPETASLCRPLRLSEGSNGGVLTLKAEPGAALFLQHESRALCERINAYLGRQAVRRLRFIQGPVQQRAKPAPRKAAAQGLPGSDPAQNYQGPERLREALLKLARSRQPLR
jgi:hypothetical protein